MHELEIAIFKCSHLSASRYSSKIISHLAVEMSYVDFCYITFYYLCKTCCSGFQLMAKSSFKHDCIYYKKACYSVDTMNS